ncbi:MAG TPA: DUF3634 family protein [Planctomycetaceae bacterium]|jgi:hypothetical protein|nr:DUF3634 family protein [Planctomycetaceae bacterium]
MLAWRIFLEYAYRTMRELSEILIVGCVVWAAWIALSPKPVFKIRVAKGSVRVTKGKVTADFQQQAADILQQWKISRGWIGAVKRGRRLTLVFSHSVPPGCRQQLRNLWTNC